MLTKFSGVESDRMVSNFRRKKNGKLFCCAHVFQGARQSGRLREEVVKSMKSMSVSKSFVCLFVITSGYFLLT